MIGKYKIIALCTCRLQDNECHQFINALHKRLTPMGYRLFVYSGCSDTREGKENTDAQLSIYDLVDSSFVDAVIVHTDRIKNPTVYANIIKQMKAAGLPVIVLGDRFDGCLNIGYDYNAGFANVVEHLVVDHGITDLHMIAGVKDNEFSDERIAAFKDVLTRHGIPFSPDMVSYGDFWSIPAVAAVEALMQKGRLPRALVCANDYMAIAVADHLKENGISIPDDVIVTGFDGTSVIYCSEPTVTSVHVNDDDVIDVICDSFSKMFEGKDYAGDVSIVPQTIYNESCGCTPTKKENGAALFNEQHNLFYRFQNENIILSKASATIQKCGSLGEIAYAMRKNDMMYGMCCLVKKEFIDESVNPEQIMEHGFGDELFLLYDADLMDNKKRQGEQFVQYYMPADEIIPNLEHFLEDGRIFIFTALHYLDVPMGYLCFYFSEYADGNYYKVPQTTNVLNNALGGLRSLRHQRYLLKQIDNMSRIDVLTGLFNRRGFLIEYSKLTEGSEIVPLTVIMCDVDGLKYINDTFGHEEGDVVIYTVAQALKQSCPSDAIITRFGGDEMMAVFKSGPNGGNFQAMLDERLAQFNERSGKPYKAAASVGVYHTDENKKLSFEELIKKSDVLMYEEKRRRKSKA
ncbi:MAG: GGDEF domain-containing protein [Eubacterium sp.]|nr:GGDEF domain-containing protein [Eubacterium sp.]